MALKEEYGKDMELDEYDVDSQNPNPKGEDNEDLLGMERVEVTKKQVSVGPGKTITTVEKDWKNNQL